MGGAHGDTAHGSTIPASNAGRTQGALTASVNSGVVGRRTTTRLSRPRSVFISEVTSRTSVSQWGPRLVNAF